MKLHWIVRATIQMHLSKSVYYTVQSCLTTYQLWKTLSDTYEKTVAAMKIYLIRCLYNLRMKESDSVQAHLNDHKSINSQILAQGMTIEDEIKALLLMSSLPPSWETFVTTMCNTLATVVKYFEITSSTLSKDTRRKTFVHKSVSDAFVIQSLVDQPNSQGRSSSQMPHNARGRSQSKDTQTCNYCMKLGYIKT